MIRFLWRLLGITRIHKFTLKCGHCKSEWFGTIEGRESGVATSMKKLYEIWREHHEGCNA